VKEIIHFAHANGFPSPCYRKMFSYLLADYDLSYIDTIGHKIHYPVTDNWLYLAEELIHNIERYHGEPVIGVGHSLGGVLNYLAACERPDLFKAIVLLDSPVFGFVKSHMIRLMKKLSLIDIFSPGKRTKRRKNIWKNRGEVYEYLKSKPIFANFDEDCLNDYIEFGMSHHEYEVRLRFNREIESEIYRTLPHHLGQLKSKLNIKCGLLYGDMTTVIKPRDIHFMQKKLGFEITAVKGGHLFPFEHPKIAAEALKAMIKRLL